MTEINVEDGAHASFTTVRQEDIDNLKRLWPQFKAHMLRTVDSEDYVALGETLEASKERVNTLEADIATAGALIATLRETLRDTQQSAAISRQALQAVRDQLKDAREEASSLHGELRKCRTTAALDGARLAAVLDVLNAVAGIISSARIMGGVSVIGTQDVRIGKLPYDELERAFLGYANAAQQEAQTS